MSKPPLSRTEVLRGIKRLYLWLLEIKDRDDFHEYGYGQGGPYKEFLPTLLSLISKLHEEDLQSMINFSPTQALSPLYIRQMGLDYMKTGGKETEFTKDVRIGLTSFFDTIQLPED